MSSSGSDGSSSRYQRMTVVGVGDVVEHRAADDRAVLADVVAAERERRDDAEVAAAAAQRPEEIGVRVIAGGDEAAVGEHDVGGEQVVDGEPEAPGQVADAAAEGEPADAGVEAGTRTGSPCRTHRWRGRRRPRCSRRRRARCALRDRRSCSASYRRSITRASSQTPRPPALCATAANGELDAVLAGEVDAGDDVGDVGAPGDGGRSPVDHSVVDGTGLVVARVAGSVRAPRIPAASSSKGRSVARDSAVVVVMPNDVRRSSVREAFGSAAG